MKIVETVNLTRFCGMGEGMPESMDVTVSFVHADDMTTMTVCHMGSEQAGMGWEQAFDKLAAVFSRGLK